MTGMTALLHKRGVMDGWCWSEYAGVSGGWIHESADPARPYCVEVAVIDGVIRITLLVDPMGPHTTDY
jgi:hypothetical protein